MERGTIIRPSRVPLHVGLQVSCTGWDVMERDLFHNTNRSQLLKKVNLSVNRFFINVQLFVGMHTLRFLLSQLKCGLFNSSF